VNSITGESTQLTVNDRTTGGSVASMDESRDQGPTTPRAPLSASHAARLLRLGAEHGAGPEPTAEAFDATEGGWVVPAEEPGSSGAPVPARIGGGGARITLLVLSATGLLTLGPLEIVQVPANGPAGGGSVHRDPRPAARAKPGDPGSVLASPETGSMQKQFMGAAAIGAAMMIADVGHAQAVQWRVEDGGNGHWYRGMRASSELSWVQARDLATSLGGHLATVTSEAEYQRVHGTAGDSTLWNGRVGPWLGGYQDRTAADYAEPAGGWNWVTGEPWFPKWSSGEPNDYSNLEDYLHYFAADLGSRDLNLAARQWNDFALVGYNSWPTPIGLVIEWSADCNNDGLVDYGQILQGQLADLNANGIPDVCEQPTCANADLFRDYNVNGADLGILLAQWGPATSLTVSDLNRDGVVDGLDLGLLLAFWGPCPG
jgi:hypothetical protein